MPWKAFACRSTGTSHQKLELPCQDYAQVIKVDDSGKESETGDILIGAVSDGAGSCKHSDTGSKLAVNTALKCFQILLKWIKDNDNSLDEKFKKSYQKLFEKVLQGVKDKLAHEADLNSWSIKDLSCTLLVVVATPKWLAAMQVGDGFIVIQKAGSEEYELLFEPSKGEYANETTFVTSATDEMMECRFIDEKQRFIFASTDGLERLAIHIKDWQPHKPFFDNFKIALTERSEDEEKKSTQEWLDSENINQKTDDDKTILLCLYTPPSCINEESEISENDRSIEDKKKDDHLWDFSTLTINVLAGIFWNSLYHDLFYDFDQGNNLRNLIGLVIALVLTLLIGWVNWQLYQQKPKDSQNQIKEARYMAILSLLGLAVGGVLYFIIKLFIIFINQL